MSEPELLAYMTGGNDDFDLPRWSTQTLHDNLSSSAQAAQSAAQASYLYAQGPPQSGANRLPPLQQSPSGSSRQPRITQLVEEEYPLSSLPYSNPALGRSISLGHNSSSSSRGRRHPMQDDLEGAFNIDTDSGARHVSHGMQAANASAYPSVDDSAGSGGAAQYQTAYYNSPGGHQVKRSHTQHDSTTSTRSQRSPNRGAPPSTALLDPYSPQQAQYSSNNASYPYSPTSEQQRAYVPGAYQSHSQTHSRSQSLVKGEAPTPPVPPPYSPRSGGSVYSGSYPMDTTSPAPSVSQSLAPHRSPRQTSISQPATPLSYGHPSQSPQFFAQEHQPMAVDTSPKRRASGLRRVRDHRDLQPHVNAHPGGRRMDTTGTFLSPIKQLTTGIVETYHICNPQYRYESTHNPRRVLTKPSKPAHNDGYDNEDYDYILYVNDWLGTDDGHKYLILDILGQGTFGQVVKCQNMKTHEVVAVKVVKNKPAYFNQSMMEVTILELLNSQCDPQDEHHILRLRDSFIHKSHLCLVFELLSSNLYELIKQNQFQGLSTQLVKVFTAQLLDAMTILKEARLIHCDLKPENILLKSLQSPQIKVIDFGSACHERQTVYTYIQSRFYRSPEVLLGIPYTAAIDMWSLGCIAVELFLGLPLFPGTSEYNQITRIVEMLGNPPQYMMDMGKQTGQFFDSYIDSFGQKQYKLKSIEQYSREHNTQEQPGKQYFKANSLPEIIQQAPMPSFKSGSRQAHEVEKEMNNRASFIDFCQGLLNMNSIERWTPQQARMHPFITGEKWTKPWTPTGQPPPQVSPPASGGTDPKRPYGGLVPSQPKGTRAYQDAAAYNQHLAQHQAYTAQAQAASQAAQNVYRNPYVNPQSAAPSATSYSGASDNGTTSSGAKFTSQQYTPSSTSQSTSHRGLTHQTSHGHLNVNTGVSQYGGHGSGAGFASQSHLGPAAPSNTYYSTTRNRSNTLNPMIDNIPPALARLQHMNQDVIGGRKALTPVLKRDDAMREWERRQAAGKAAAAQPYPQLEFLQQQAELAAAQGLTHWGHSGPSNRYQHQPTSNLAHSYHPSTSMVVDEDRRDAILSNVRSAARTDGTSNLFGSTSNVIPSPPQAYSSNSTTTGNRYAATYPQQQQAPTSPFESVERRTDIGSMYVPMQPDQYGSYNNQAAGSQQHGASARHVAPPAQTVPPSFYGAGAMPPPNGQQRNPFAPADTLPTAQGQASTKDARRKSGMDLWTQ